MPFASGADTRVAYVAESTFGTTPATPAFKVMRVTSTGLRPNKTTTTSEEIRADRNIVDEMMAGVDVSGSLPFEMSHASFDDMFEAALMGTWASNVLTNGTTRRSFTFEETNELDATDAFHRFRGVMVNELSLSVTAREKVTGSIGLMGIQEAVGTAAVAGATYTAANTEPVTMASTHVGVLTIGSFNPQPKIRSVSVQISNGLRTRPVVGSLFSEEFGLGMANVTGQIEAYVENLSLYEAALNHASPAITITMGVDTNKKYTILIPKAVFGSPEKTAAGQTTDVMVRVPFRGVLSGGRSIQITRAVA